MCNLQTLHLTPDTPRQLSTSSEVEYQSLISFRRILSRLHLLRRLSPLLNNARKYISDRCYNGTIMSTLFVMQYCHVHFHGGGVVVLESTYSTPRNPLCTTKEFFLCRFINEYYAFARWRYFTTTTRILFVFSFHVFFF